jgi:hypothetical protein
MEYLALATSNPQTEYMLIPPYGTTGRSCIIYKEPQLNDALECTIEITFCSLSLQARSISGENENNTVNEWASCLHILLNNAPKHIEGLLMSSRLQNELRHSVPLTMFIIDG